MMFRDLLSSRLIQVGLAFFVLIVGGSLLYNWHVHRTPDPKDALLQHRENQNETHTTQDTVETSTVDLEQTETPLEIEGTQRSEKVGKLPNDDISENSDMTGVFPSSDGTLTDKEEPVEDVPVSPYGFGPYPEVPNDFPFTPTWLWPEASLQNVDGLMYHELRFRVLIKLWSVYWCFN